MLYRVIIFLVINFGALALGNIWTSDGVASEWYADLNKAPWTPPGWVFGLAWTTIMLCFSVYMAYLWPVVENKSLVITLFVIQLIFNISWNPIFFHYHHILLGLVVIASLTILIGYLLIGYWSHLKFLSLLIAPYFLWLIIATSLNAYILANN